MLNRQRLATLENQYIRRNRWEARNTEETTNWQRDTGTHRLNTLGDEGQVQTIKAGQTINKGGA